LSEGRTRQFDGNEESKNNKKNETSCDEESDHVKGLPKICFFDRNYFDAKARDLLSLAPLEIALRFVP
jgi:hypothetical protein